MISFLTQKKSIQYVIVGNSAAGISAAKEIRRYDPKGRITLVSDELAYGYSRVMLPLYIAGKVPERRMTIAGASFYSSLRIHLLRGEFVEAIDTKNQRIQILSGALLPYDCLLIATGSSPKGLVIPGKDLLGIHTLRKITDAQAIRKDIPLCNTPVLVLGGGLVGVKSVEALLARKKKIHWVISSNRILSQILDKTASDLLLKAFERKGVSVHLNMDVTAFQGSKRLAGVVLSDGEVLPCGLVIIGKGVNPNIDSFSGTGISVNQGIIVDDHMVTNLASIYAAGDVVEAFDVIKKKNSTNALWPLAVEGGRIAGSNMAGVPASFSRVLRMNSMEVLGVKVISAGDWEGGEEIKTFQEEGTIYRKLIYSEGTLKGFILVGDIQNAGILTTFVKNQTEIALSVLKKGLDLGFSYQPRLLAIKGRIKRSESEGNNLEN
jgi:nitrite reductase (NADH) large subunit